MIFTKTNISKNEISHFHFHLFGTLSAAWAMIYVHIYSSYRILPVVVNHFPLPAIGLGLVRLFIYILLCVIAGIDRWGQHWKRHMYVGTFVH